jgi:hypothetical protein
MPGGSVLDVVQGPAERIGRYFSVLSVVSSAMLVVYLHALVASHAWSGSPNWSQAAHELSDVGFGGAVLLALATLAIGLVLQPLQYAFVQLCEGYWGVTRTAQALMRAKVAAHQGRRARLEDMMIDDLSLLEEAGESPYEPTHRDVSRPNLEALHRYGEAERLLTNYPHRMNDVRPTRLGNILRRYEAGAGVQYGLSLPTIAPHLILAAPRQHIAYVEDQRTQLDLAVRLAVVGVVGTAASILFLWRAGLWLLLALVPYALCYLSYRGALVAAAEYGTALATVIDLDRFELYEQLHVSRPDTPAAEWQRNRKLMDLLTNRPRQRDPTYRHPPTKP